MVRSSDSHFKLVSGASFSTGGVLECNIIAHRRSGAVLCVLCKIMCNPMHSLYGAPQTSNMPDLHGWLHPVPLLHIGILMPLLAVEYLSVSMWNFLINLYSMAWDSLISSTGPMLLYWPQRLPHFLSLIIIIIIIIKNG